MEMIAGMVIGCGFVVLGFCFGAYVGRDDDLIDAMADTIEAHVANIAELQEGIEAKISAAFQDGHSDGWLAAMSQHYEPEPEEVQP